MRKFFFLLLIALLPLGISAQTSKTADVAFVTAPPSFTPNNDGKNDTWQITGTSIIAVDLKIYDNFGNFVAKLSKPSDAWDGKKKGGAVPAGVYVYKGYITEEGKEKQKVSGQITLTR